LLTIFLLSFLFIYLLDRIKKEKSSNSPISQIKSGIDSVMESVMNNRLNFSFDIRLFAPLVVVIISDRKKDILAIDLGFVEIKTGKLRKIVHDENASVDENTTKNTENILRKPSDDYSISGFTREAEGEESNIMNENERTYAEECSYGVIDISLSEIEFSMISIIQEKDEKEKNNRNNNNNNTVFPQDNTSRMGERNVKSRLIEKFDVHVEVQISENPWGTSSPPIRIFFDLPEINIR
jgi:Repeating coiled region of VPS13